jgi:hypothetical protein
MSGNISKTYIKEGSFRKRVPVSGFDLRTVSFQSMLRQIINGKFSVNRYEQSRVLTSGSELEYELEFDLIDEKEWAPNPDNMRIIGKSMSIIHNYCFRNNKHISLDTKNSSYDNMDSWLSINRNIPFKDDSYSLRRDIFRNIKKFNAGQPKIALHRDFKPHNILYDGDSYNLIDFDFAAKDFVSIEIMSFIVDVMESGKTNVRTFIESYIENSEIPVKYNSLVDDYLAYLCTNTFPFYMHDKLNPQNFKNLVEHRNNSLILLYENRESLSKIITETQNKLSK